MNDAWQREMYYANEEGAQANCQINKEKKSELTGLEPGPQENPVLV